MSREWLWVVPLAVGHCAFFAVLVNMAHGLGQEERVSNRFKLLLVGAFLAISAAMVWLVVRRPLADWPGVAVAYAAVCLAVALVGLPLTTIGRALRRVPAGIHHRGSDEIDLGAIHGPEALIGPGRSAFLLRLPGNESLRLRRLEWDVAIPTLPRALDGLSVVHLSDLHFSLAFQRVWFERLAELAAEYEADLVVFTGDLVDDDRSLEWVEPVLGRVRGRLGTYGILGNHDLSHHPLEVRRRLESAGFVDLEGRWTSLAVGQANVALGGTSYPWGPALNPSEAPEADLRILLSHTPDLFYRASNWGVDLMLSGHNHGGQVRLPIVGPVVMPSLYSRRFDRGFFRRGPTLLHVSQGMGAKHPVRYGCVPELSRFVLRAPTVPGQRASAKDREGAETLS